ncbi:hypothetical protein [Microvirga arabica]|uniref:hypothetical protein n=1 Tax=Microvirga arabica TaxID=1128671 RepID=UPI00193A02B1|nr:hypothetical protein [Microvirga arabica]MBM1175491.1 hypothetical protein [Microvirga arabica]
MTLGEAAFLAFSACNFLRLGSYVPQIIRVARDQHGASCISFTSWSIFLLANSTTAAHAAVNLGDGLLALISAVNAICCLAIVALTAWKRAALRPDLCLRVLSCLPRCSYRWPRRQATATWLGQRQP